MFDHGRIRNISSVTDLKFFFCQSDPFSFFLFPLPQVKSIQQTIFKMVHLIKDMVRIHIFGIILAFSSYLKKIVEFCGFWFVKLTIIAYLGFFFHRISL